MLKWNLHQKATLAVRNKGVMVLMLKLVLVVQIVLLLPLLSRVML